MAYHTEKTNAGTDIVIDGFENGVSNNPYQGLADLRNVDTVTVPGEVSVALSTQSNYTQGTISGVVFTVDNTTDIFTYDGVVPLELYTAITVSNSGGALPTGMSTNTAYYVASMPTPTTFTLSTSAGGTALNVTSNGSGTNTFSTINMGTPKFFAENVFSASASFYRQSFLGDSNGRIWILNNGGVISGTQTDKWVYMSSLSSEGSTKTCNGLVGYKNYLFWFASGSINVMPVIDWSTGFPTLSAITLQSSWNIGWNTVVSSGSTSNDSRYAIVGYDEAVYFCANQYVGSILEVSNSSKSSVDQQSFNIATTKTIATGATTIGSTTITTGTAFFEKSDIGAIITGTNIPANTVIAAVVSATQATLVFGGAATGTGGGLTFTITSAYTFNNKALALPYGELATCLEQLGQNLLIGGINNYLYQWDRVSTTYSSPLLLSENYTTRMVTVNTTTYIFCGYKGRVYQTNGSNVSKFWEVPEYMSNTVNPYFTWTDAKFNRNQIYFGFQSSTNDGTTLNTYGGLWAIDSETGSGRLQNMMSYGSYSGYVSAIGINRSATSFSATPANDGYGLYMGWYNGTKGGCDKGISTPYTGTQAIVVSDMIPVGQFLNPKTFNQIEFILSSPLVSGESVTLAWRQNMTDSFTSIPINEGGNTNQLSGIAFNNFQNVQFIQVQATLTSTATNPSYVRLKQLRIR